MQDGTTVELMGSDARPSVYNSERITNKGERIALTLWSVAVLLTSLIGDSVVLIATTRHKAVRLHRVLVALLQHLAVSNLLQTLFRVLPVTPTFTTDYWVLGTLLCHLEDSLGIVCPTATMLLTCCLSTVKLLLVRFPLRASVWSAQFGHQICAGLWVLTLVWYSPALAGKMLYLKKTINFSLYEYQCNYNMTSADLPQTYRSYLIVSFPVISLLSYTLLIVTSILLLVIAKRAGGRAGSTLRWEGVVTVLLTVGVLLVSYFPLSVVVIAWLLEVRYSGTVWRAAAAMQYLNIVANFFIYPISVESFREFLKVRLNGVINFFTPRRRSDIMCVRPRQASRATPAYPEIEFGERDDGARDGGAKG
ncbi:hypothetical protein ACHWQZ_G008993 [Mnemiopsis leidyi]